MINGKADAYMSVPGGSWTCPHRFSRTTPLAVFVIYCNAYGVFQVFDCVSAL
uniref:Uncharacterized protein n=1 Tax=Anguilla anguilla TaxID=7936 RepID=A0A0E9R4T5_ANGAN